MTSQRFLDLEPETDGDAAFRNFMRDNLAHAAAQVGAVIAMPPVFGWRLKSISAPVRIGQEQAWLRLVSQESQWASGDHWTGTIDANDISGIRKPRVLDVHEWCEGNWRTQRAELMTLVPGRPCSPTDVLRAPIDLPGAWWTELDRALSVLASVQTKRVNADQQKITDRVHECFGDGIDTTVSEWETVHGDLHWSNLHRPEFALLDWELWGRGPAGLDVATLHLFSLLQPHTAQHVYARFVATLDRPTGRVAQLYAAARLLRRINDGDFPDLEQPVKAHAAAVLARHTQQ